MKKLTLLTLLLALILGSCSKNVNPLDVVLQADEATLKTKTVTFDLITEFKSAKETSVDSFKLSMKRNPNDTILGFMVRFQNNAGLIGTYNSNDARFTIPQDKKVMYIDSNSQPASFIMNSGLTFAYFNFMTIKSQKENINKIKDSLIYVGSETIDGIEVFNIKKIGSAEGGVKVIEIISYASTDKLPRKYERVSIYQKDSIKFTFNFKNVIIDSDVNDKVFQLETPAGYTIDVIKPTEDNTGLKVGDEAPNFSLLDANGKDISLKSLKGKVVLLDFWGTWCKWCVKAMPKIEEVFIKYKGKNLAVYGISCQEPENANPDKFMKDNKVTYKTLLKGDAAAAAFKVTGFPTLYLIDKKGKILNISTGYDENLLQNLSPIIDKNL